MSAREQPSDRNINRSVTGLPVRYVGVPLQGAIDAGTRSGALPDADTVNAAMSYLDDVKSSDNTMTRIAAVMLLEEQFGLYHIEADAVYEKWSKEKMG